MQDELVTIRGERFVIPVKIEQKRRVNGVVHGASSSGQTVFIEPLETIEQNNELVRLLEEENAEIHRILLDMTGRIGEVADALEQASVILGEIELQFAKAKFARDYQCVRPLLSNHKITKSPNHEISEPAGDQRSNLLPPVIPFWNAISKPQAAISCPFLLRSKERAATRHQRPEYRREDGRAKDRRPAGSDGAVGHPCSGRVRGTAGVRRCFCRYRRLSVDRAKSLYFFRACEQHRFHFQDGHAAFAGAAGRTRLGHRSGRRRGFGRGHRQTISWTSAQPASSPPTTPR